MTALVSDALKTFGGEIFYFGGQPDFSPSIDRLRGFQAALAQCGMVDAPDRIRARDYRRSSGYQLMQACYRELGRYPKLLFTGAITLLEGALAFISENRHFDIAPQRIITFDDHNLLDCLPLRIDSIEQDSEALAAASLEKLLGLIGEKKQPLSQTIPARLHWRSRRP